MGFMDSVEKASEKKDFGGEFINENQTGTILLHSVTFYETDTGKWGAMNGEIVESSPRVQGALVQKPGTAVKALYKCHGKWANIGYEGIVKLVRASFGTGEDKAKLMKAVSACFGDDKDGLTSKASDEARANPFFGARGVLVKFTSKPSKSNEKRAKEGKSALTDVSWAHIDQEPEDIIKRAKELPEVE